MKVSPGYRCLRRYVRPEIKVFAKKLRKSQTPAERKLWSYIRCKGMGGLIFRRQHIVRGYIVDFYCPSKRLAIELDGRHHDPKKDRVRDARIWRNTRIKIIRFPNADVEKDIVYVLSRIADACKVPRSRRIPLHSSQQQGTKTIKRKKSEKNLTRGGNVKNDPYLLQVRELTVFECESLVEKVLKGPACKKQACASIEVAENTARFLTKHGIPARAEACPRCRMAHVVL